jgi:hypothetical protein
MISDPFDVPVAVGALQAVTTGGLVYPVGAPGSVVGDTLYSFGPSSTAYSSVTGGSLQPFVGYWIYAFQNCTLTFPAMPGTPSPPPPLVRGAVAK